MRYEWGWLAEVPARPSAAGCAGGFVETAHALVERDDGLTEFLPKFELSRLPCQQCNLLVCQLANR